jgi:hypothetical protein
MIRVHHQAGTCAQYPHFALNARGLVFFYPGFHGRDDLVRVLFGNQPQTDFGYGFGGDDGFRTRSGKAAGNAVNLKRRTRPGALEDRIFAFTGQRSGPDFRLQIFLLVEGKPGPAFLLLL